MKQFALLGVFVIACLPQAETRWAWGGRDPHMHHKLFVRSPETLVESWGSG